mmetsp:Transcript_52735/g.98720  ORF Transcript_52735/g.98720 Transcript_52735/m.98720 type:complete len:271 (+) Transcript_52735:146-958(+)
MGGGGGWSMLLRSARSWDLIFLLTSFTSSLDCVRAFIATMLFTSTLACGSLVLAWRSKSSHMLCSLWATGISHLPRITSDLEVFGRTCLAARTGSLASTSLFMMLMSISSTWSRTMASVSLTWRILSELWSHLSRLCFKSMDSWCKSHAIAGPLNFAQPRKNRSVLTVPEQSVSSNVKRRSKSLNGRRNIFSRSRTWCLRTSVCNSSRSSSPEPSVSPSWKIRLRESMTKVSALCLSSSSFSVLARAADKVHSTTTPTMEFMRAREPIQK